MRNDPILRLSLNKNICKEKMYLSASKEVPVIGHLLRKKVLYYFM